MCQESEIFFLGRLINISEFYNYDWQEKFYFHRDEKWKFGIRLIYQILKISFVILSKFSFNLGPLQDLYIIYIYAIKKDILNVGEYKSF